MENAATYISYDPNPSTRDAAAKLLVEAKAGSETALAELQQCMDSRLEFGTAGLRGEMGIGFTRMNDLTVIQAAQGLADFVLSTGAAKMGVVVGYDHRARGELGSHRFALLTTAALVTRGVPVHLYRGIVCTPLVPYGILHLGAAAGVMIIAPVDKAIAASILRNCEPWADAAPLYATLDVSALEATLRANALLVSDPTQRVEEAYFNAIGSSLCHHRGSNESPGGCPVRIAYTAMHGVGAPFTARSFAAFGLPPFEPTPEQCTPDPEFPTVAFPNPEEGKGALALAMATADRVGATIIVANDPDADRMAVAEKGGSDHQWRVFTGNETGVLLAHWLWTKYCEKKCPRDPEAPLPLMIASTVSSKMLAAVAAAEGFAFQETLTGFKWMGNAMADAQLRGQEVLFAFEEAIGFCCGEVVRDKDGVAAAAVFVEMVQALARSGSTVASHLDSLYARYGFFTSCNYYVFVDSPAKTAAIFERLRAEGHYWARLGDLRITAVRDLTATALSPKGWDSEQPDGLPKLPVSASSQMLTFKFSNTVVATLRGSGTEPKLKVYCEIRGSDAEQARSEVNRTARLILEEMLQPEVRGLRRPAGVEAAF